MARVCEISGKKTTVGNNVSHSNNKVRRKFYPNLHKKRFYLAEEDRWVTLKVAASVIKTINKKGLGAVLQKAKQKGMISKAI